MKSFIFVCVFSKAVDIFSLITNEPLQFRCENFQKWKDGRCIESGYYDGTVSITSKDSPGMFHVDFDKDGSVETTLHEDYKKVSELNGKAVLRSSTGRELTIIANRDDISCLRFSQDDVRSNIEYYGKACRTHLRTIPGREIKFPSKKDEYRSEMYEDLRFMLRDNTYVPTPIDLQAEVVAFASRKYMEFYDNYISDDRGSILEPMRNHIFKDTWSLLYSEILPGASGVFLDGIVSDAKEWYDNLTKIPRLNVRSYLTCYYAALHSTDGVNYASFISRYAMNYSGRMH